MKLEWTEHALKAFHNIRSDHFSSSETREYKKRLVKDSKQKVSLLGTSIPVEAAAWEGSYKIIIDKFIIYYSFSEDREICYIEYFKHSSQRQ
ncbi:hypothetical protein HUG15_02695 [Salicibibacter cibarius]|uniref:Type II toxin-antitoxin system RelE/ParE family toxin n=1 Tax=Salicibibacter cibarius TaxID=2743000 RepID=A0A7T7CA91_9BACI|nr:hypothetical protein [Salicibibacter cibarius]QQK74615.1 hypothetical protein HUG15_02695 [Salicibibacter cibarius]